MNCGIGDDRIQHCLWRAQIPPASQNLKIVVVLYGTNNLLLNSPKYIADGILETTRSFEMNYSCVNVIICGILPRDYSWSVNRVSIKRVNQILKLECCESSYTYASHGRGWTLADGSLNADLYCSDRLHLVEKGNQKLAESIFNSIEVSNNSNHNNKFSKSYKNGCVFQIKQRWVSTITFSFYLSAWSIHLCFITIYYCLQTFSFQYFLIGYLPLLQTHVFLVLLTFHKIIFFLNLYLTLPSRL